MKHEPKVGEVTTWKYQRYKCVKSDPRNFGDDCISHCALKNLVFSIGLYACKFVHCSSYERKDGLEVHFVKMAPRKRKLLSK